MEALMDCQTAYMRTACNHSVLDETAERRLIRSAQGGDLAARNQLIASNQRLVVLVAKRYLAAAEQNGLEMMDLIQSGQSGLMEAIARFDLTRPFRFSTYAMPWIRQSIQRATVKDTPVALSYQANEERNRVRRARARLMAENRREPTLAEIAAAAGLREDRMQEIAPLLTAVSSLDAPVSDDGDSASAGEMLAGNADGPEDVVERADMAACLQEHVSSLCDRYQVVLRHRFGLHGADVLTYEQIGRELGISRERARQIEAQALAELRRRMALIPGGLMD